LYQRLQKIATKLATLAKYFQVGNRFGDEIKTSLKGIAFFPSVGYNITIQYLPIAWAIKVAVLQSDQRLLSLWPLFIV
jgi:hypothetical protein